MLLCRVPVLLRRRQYLQSFLRQKEYPLFLVLPPCGCVGLGILVLVSGGLMTLVLVGVSVTNSSVLVCRVVRGACGVVWTFGGVTYSGSTSSSPGIFCTLALQSMSLRFFGRL